MKKLTVIMLISVALAQVKADEGMWLLPYIEQLNIAEMNKMGCNLTPEQIYSVNNSSIKDAIVIFGGGCTGEIVSGKGLLFTNHHCGFDYIQNHSSVENDYLTNGFWAQSLQDELPNPDLSVKFLTRIQDVTARFDSALSDTMSYKTRRKTINKLSDYIEDSAPEDSTHSIKVYPFFNNNQYLLVVYQVFNDVRLVGAPPASVGKFGGDTDNWMWPRHTGDFSIFRVYTAPDGSPAEYSEENVPLKPKHSLPIEIGGVKENDYAMVLGFPGSTTRHITSFGLNQTTNITNNNRIEIRQKRLEVLGKAMDKSNEVRIKYATKYAQSANYYKYSIGQNRGVRRLGLFEKKRAIETNFQQWANSTDERRAQYGTVLENLEKAYKNRYNYQHHIHYIYESFFYPLDILDLASELPYLNRLLKNDSTTSEQLNEEIDFLKEYAEKFFKEYDLATDKSVAIALTKNYYNTIDKSRQPELIRSLGEKTNGGFVKYFDKMYAKSILADKAKFNAFLANPSSKKIQKDPAYELLYALRSVTNRITSAKRDYDNAISTNNRLFLRGLQEMDPTLVTYPDANFTMRMTFGEVLSYKPFDAGYYNYYTTQQGIIEKEDSTSKEFMVPEKLMELIETKDFGPYGDSTLVVNFITNNDITGGNSGSPVLDKNGSLIGLAFDGNWEAMSGDIVFEPEIQRCIVVDIRYVLFIIDKFAGAQHIIDELNIL